MFSKIMILDPNKRSQYRMHEKDLFSLFPTGLSFFILKLYFTFWDVLSLFALDDILVNTKWKQWKIHFFLQFCLAFRLKYLFKNIYFSTIYFFLLFWVAFTLKQQLYAKLFFALTLQFWGIFFVHNNFVGTNCLKIASFQFLVKFFDYSH